MSCVLLCLRLLEGTPAAMIILQSSTFQCASISCHVLFGAPDQYKCLWSGDGNHILLHHKKERKTVSGKTGLKWEFSRGSWNLGGHIVGGVRYQCRNRFTGSDTYIMGGRDAVLSSKFKSWVSSVVHLRTAATGCFRVLRSCYGNAHTPGLAECHIAAASSYV